MFGKKKNEPSVSIESAPSNQLLSRIISRSSKAFSVSEYEKTFFAAFENAIQKEGFSMEWFSVERMSNGSIRVECSAGIVGTVHLRKKIGSIQYFLSPLDIHDMEDAPLEAVIAVIPYWIAYIKDLFRMHTEALY